jgi:hypothetical protein
MSACKFRSDTEVKKVHKGPAIATSAEHDVGDNKSYQQYRLAKWTYFCSYILPAPWLFGVDDA